MTAVSSLKQYGVGKSTSVVQEDTELVGDGMIVSKGEQN